MNATPPPRERLDALVEALGARAAGVWRVSKDRRTLDLVAFSAAVDMPEAVASGFVEATRSVPLVEAGFGIVGAAQSGEVSVSRLSAISSENGSGLWLRRFGAGRSIAVPFMGASGEVLGVIAIAIGEGSSDDEDVSRGLREVASAIFEGDMRIAKSADHGNAGCLMTGNPGAIAGL